DSQLKYAKDTYAALSKSLVDSDKSTTHLTLHGPLDHRASLCSIGPSGFLALTRDARPFYDPREQQLGYFQGLEQLSWQSRDTAPRTIFQGYNVDGYPSASPDGGTVVYVEDLFGALSAVNVVRGTLPPKRVFMDEKLHLSEPKVSANGEL